MKRTLNLVYTPKEHPGFLGPDHTARYVIEGDFEHSDPFIMLADDVLDKKNNDPVGGPHPHAGFETVTLILEGELGAGAHKMVAGDFQLMTAGSGVVHTETIDQETKMRVLQLWLTLPEKNRWATPRLQELPAKDVPTLMQNGQTIKLYSGHFAGLSSPVLNHVPLIVADIRLQAGTVFNETLPGAHTSFLYVIDGSVKVGDGEQWLQPNQVGWLNKTTDVSGELELHAGENGARLILYSAQSQGNSIVSHGPFIGNTAEDIQRLYKEYRTGKIPHVHTLPKEQLMVW